MTHVANPQRYAAMTYNRCGTSGVRLPAVSLGLWQNFGGLMPFENSRAMVLRAFDLGIVHFDLANNYGPPPGSAEETFGRILAGDLAGYRDELVVSTKAGYTMWDGPYGDWGSRKYLVSSLDQSLRRMGLEYVDIFYHHRPDPATPLEETMAALDHVVRQGKALYAGLSNYDAEGTRAASTILKRLGTPCLIHQPRYSMFDRWVEKGLLDATREEGIGVIAFTPLAQGLLTDRYLEGVPGDSRAASNAWVQAGITPERIAQIRALRDVAATRGQSLAQMALAWVLRGGRVTSVLIGASRVSQIEEDVGALDRLDFTAEELQRIDAILAG